MLKPADSEVEIGVVRVIDESGEDYLYPKHWFVLPEVASSLGKVIHAGAHRNGFYEGECNRPCTHKSGSICANLMLIVSELAEAMEADRKGEREHFKEELADVAIRLFDMAYAEKIDLDREIGRKMAANMKRPYLHGDGKRY